MNDFSITWITQRVVLRPVPSYAQAMQKVAMGGVLGRVGHLGCRLSQPESIDVSAD
jgi:hypothetical protein